MLTSGQDVRYSAEDGSFHFNHRREERPNPHHYRLHYETGYEIYMFVSGEGRYNIEGTRYDLEPYSILMMNSNELHALEILPHAPYERIVLTLRSDFLPPFLSHGVDFFRSIKYRKLGCGNQIKAGTVKEIGLLELFGRMQELLAAPSPENEFVAKCVIVQILNALNQALETGPAKAAAPRPAIGKIGVMLEYINANLGEPLTLDALSEHFYLTKYHLCRIFKEATGYSINQYITFKRIRLADGLMLEGYPPTQACFMSGFNSYSNFYKAYRKLTGRSPRKPSGE